MAFVLPGRVNPNAGLDESVSRTANSLDGIFNAYMQGKQMAQQRQAQQGANLLQYGFNPADVTPDIMAQAGQAAPGGVMAQPSPLAARQPQMDMMAPQEQAGPLQSNYNPQGFAQGLSQPVDQAPAQEHPLVGQVRSYLDRRKQGESQKSRGAESELALQASQTNENNAQADNLRATGGKGQVYVDPSTGRQITIPAGAKLLPPGSGNDGKMLPPATVLNLNEGKAVARMLPDVEQALQQSEGMMGPLAGRAGSANPYSTGAQTADANFRTASQAFGKFMEGGVLRKEDEEKYRKMFPQLSDTPDVAKNKLAMVRRTLAQKYEDDRQTLGRSGYDVSGAEALSIPPSIFDAPHGGGNDPSALIKQMSAQGKSRQEIKAALASAGF